eukprot:TRINITY_DN659_c0_g1_i2.p1 TRINITY_DN659_c0_g1~~TRINITY_DN659_c0_g1_i2.p1  ORF type:complete len:659 (+),score=95.56 TRINITY_DN659_c0_g1_i2:353-2329(+)
MVQSGKDMCYTKGVGITGGPGAHINLASECGFGVTVHEILHTLGLGHEQKRRDRDSYVKIDYAAIKQGGVGDQLFADQFGKSAVDESRQLGAYDYGSILHYASYAFAKGSDPTIVSPYFIGQRQEMSAGDIAGLQFIYAECQTSPFARPVCLASRAEADQITHIIPHSTDFEVEFNVVHDVGTTASYPDLAAGVTPTVAAGGAIGPIGKAVLTYSPDAADAGQTKSLSVTFTADNGAAATCTVAVEVAASTAVCFGAASTDPSVCSGHGTCQNDLDQPCVCAAGYGGIDCSGLATCVYNGVEDFDAGSTGMWTVDVFSFDDVIAVEGASWRIGAPGSSSQVAIVRHEPRQYGLVSFHLARDTTLSFRFAAVQLCASLSIDSDWIANDNDALKVAAPEAEEFIRAELRFDWAANEVSYLIDGEHIAAATHTMPAECAAGISQEFLMGTGWMDEWKTMCHGYVMLDGSLPDGRRFGPEYRLSQDDLRAGGMRLTLTLVTTATDSWVDSEGNKQALLDALRADTAVGWNERIPQLLTTEQVAFPAPTVATIGPFPAGADYTVSVWNTVGFVLDGAMFASGEVQHTTERDLSFRVRPKPCNADQCGANGESAAVNDAGVCVCTCKDNWFGEKCDSARTTGSERSATSSARWTSAARTGNLRQ